MPVWNQPELTRNCIDSLEKNTHFPYRLIVVDNASNPETVEYLESLKIRFKDKMVLVKNEKNEGFVKAVNKGLTLSDARFVCILNNDTVVTAGWLSEMVKLFDADPSIGIVNPSSNSLGQKLPRGVGIDEYAETMKSQSGRSSELPSALGFCMLVERFLFRQIGQLDELYGMGNYDDTDFSLRAKRAGVKIVRAYGSYVYHREKSSFKVLRGSTKSFEKNKEIFESRWGPMKRTAVILKDTNPDSLKRLMGIIKKHAKSRYWIYVISPPLDTQEFFANISNLTFYQFKNFFYTFAFFKILFKKKKPHLIYCDNRVFCSFLNGFKAMHKASLRMMERDTV